MNGRPVWLASVTLRDANGIIIPTARYTTRGMQKAQTVLDELLAGVGDTSREVSFRMNLSLCRHRGLSVDEEEHLTNQFKDFCPTDSAGTAIEVLWKRGVSGEAIEPCANPGRQYISDEPHFWLPIPCGKCESCVARETKVNILV